MEMNGFVQILLGKRLPFQDTICARLVYDQRATYIKDFTELVYVVASVKEQSRDLAFSPEVKQHQKLVLVNVHNFVNYEIPIL